MHNIISYFITLSENGTLTYLFVSSIINVCRDENDSHKYTKLHKDNIIFIEWTL